jgi:hypothetical protein
MWWYVVRHCRTHHIYIDTCNDVHTNTRAHLHALYERAARVGLVGAIAHSARTFHAPPPTLLLLWRIIVIIVITLILTVATFVLVVLRFVRFRIDVIVACISDFACPACFHADSSCRFARKSSSVCIHLGQFSWHELHRIWRRSCGSELCPLKRLFVARLQRDIRHIHSSRSSAQIPISVDKSYLLKIRDLLALF